MRLGPLKTMDLYLELMTQFSETQKAYQNLEESRGDWANVSMLRACLEHLYLILFLIVVHGGLE